jgi:lipoprotein-anchoring transpeptidase ErfK/SrfK
MVDYFPVLERAVAALNPNTKEARRVLYDRARRALIDGLRASDPTLSDTDLRTQSAALEAAIRRVEGDALRRTAQPVAAPPPPPAYQPAELAAAPAPPDADYQDQPPLDDERKPLRMILGAAAAVVLLIGGVAAYTFWPGKTGVPPSQRGVAGKGVESEAWGAAPYVYLRQPVYYRTTHPAGTIVVDKSQSFLYVVRPSLSALRYGIGVGPECNTTAGLYQVVRKEEWPGLKVPSGRQLSDDERNKNPFGARALYLSKESRIHGTNAPSSIGRPGSLGCFRLTNDDVIHLYERAPLETRVVVHN